MPTIQHFHLGRCLHGSSCDDDVPPPPGAFTTLSICEALSRAMLDRRRFFHLMAADAAFHSLGQAGLGPSTDLKVAGRPTPQLT